MLSSSRSPKDGWACPPSSQHCPLSEDPTLRRRPSEEAGASPSGRRTCGEPDCVLSRWPHWRLPGSLCAVHGLPPAGPHLPPGLRKGTLPSHALPCARLLGKVCPPQDGATGNTRVSSSRTPCGDAAPAWLPRAPRARARGCRLARPAPPAGPRSLHPVRRIFVPTPFIMPGATSHTSLLAATFPHGAPATAPAPAPLPRLAPCSPRRPLRGPLLDPLQGHGDLEPPGACTERATGGTLSTLSSQARGLSQASRAELNQGAFPWVTS